KLRFAQPFFVKFNLTINWSFYPQGFTSKTLTQNNRGLLTIFQAYTEIVSKYKDAQEQAQGQAVFNEQKLTNLALMLETEYLNRQNMVVDSVTKKLNYQVAVQNALEDQESQHMINWIEDKVNQDISNLDQDEMINVCVANLKKMA
ncbi:unnamed protein product, partial [Oikopleura dioica]